MRSIPSFGASENPEAMLPEVISMASVIFTLARGNEVMQQHCIGLALVQREVFPIGKSRFFNKGDFASTILLKNSILVLIHTGVEKQSRKVSKDKTQESKTSCCQTSCWYSADAKAM
jgi:hypothetical protein